MIVSTGRRYIFVHIPKTGGTSLALALEARAMKDDILIGDTPKSLRRRHRLKSVKTKGRLWKHSTLRNIYGLVDQTQIEDYFVFTLVRNPWDRMVSYFHWLQDQNFDHPAVGLAKTLDFSQFLNHPMTCSALENSPYGSYVLDENGVERCDAFVRIEYFEADFAPVQQHLGFDVGVLTRVNTSGRERRYAGYYSPADRAFLGRICATDIARFGYRFEA